MEPWIERGTEVVMHTYNRFPLVIEKGEGVYVWDQKGKKYLDFVAGIAVNSLGCNHSTFIENMVEQLHKINHCSNLYWNIPQIELAELLVTKSCFDKVFFCNSGAEAIEAALKLARKYGKKVHGADCVEIIAMEQSFHGRTLGAITATGQIKYQKDLAPLLPGILHVPYNNIEALRSAVTEHTCAILLEPIQGEGGIHPADLAYLQSVRQLCSEKNILLMFDEVQCGIGRTGKLFGYEVYGIEPDVIALAKGLGGGFPIGAMMAVQKAADAFMPGDHASTFGGNPLACTAGKVVLQELVERGLLEQVQKNSVYLKERLLDLKESCTLIQDVRGIGLMMGIELNMPVGTIIQKCMEKGLLLVGAGTHTIRFVPPLVINEKEIEEGIQILRSVLKEEAQ